MSINGAVSRFKSRRFNEGISAGLKITKSPKMMVLSLGLIFCFSFFIAILFSHFNAPVKNSDALIDPSEYNVSVTSNGNLAINISSTYEGAIGSATDNLTIKTNAPSGYKLYLSTNKTAGTNQASSLAKDNDFNTTSKFIKPVSGTITNPVVLGRNKWGFAIKSNTNGIVTNGFDSNYNIIDESSKFAKVPARTEELLIQQTNSANEVGVNLPIYYALRADVNIPSGTYSNEIVYTAIIDASNIVGEATIAPNTGPANGGTNVVIKTSMKVYPAPANLNEFLGVGGGSGVAGAPTVMIGDKACNNPTFSLDEGTLKVSCQTQANTGAKDVIINIPKLNKTYTIANGYTYQQNKTFNGITTMQQMTQQICDNETKPHAFVGGGTSGTILSATTRTHTTDKNFIPEAELIDTRDNKKYVIRKLADGNCWMVQNLDLGDTQVELTPQNTDLNGVSGFTLPAAQTSPSSWGGYNNASDVNRLRLYNDGNKWFTNVALNQVETATTNQPSDPELKLKHIGNYYNWYTATAKTGTYEMGRNQEASSSICPKGWRLPPNTGTKSYANLTQSVYKLTVNTTHHESSLKLRQKPFSFPLSGCYGYSGSVYYQGSGSYFWSSTANSNTYAYHLYFSYTNLDPASNNSKASGFSIRCQARDDRKISDITTMQEMIPEVCENTTTPYAFVNGATSGNIVSNTTRNHSTDKNLVPEAELTDTRDNKKYVIRKLADGNCWMMQNLDLGNTGQSLSLTPSDTDIASNFVLNNISNPGVSWPTSTSQSNVNTVRAIDNGDKWFTNVSSGNNETVSTSEPSNPEEKLRHIGNYYNWYTATAGSGNYNMSSGNASHSICPKGWRLPFGENTNTNKSFQRLTDTYKITNGSYVNNDQAALYKLRSKPLSMPLSGNYWSTSVSSQGSGGWFWSSTAGSQDYARYLNLSTSNVNPQNSSRNKMYGHSVRCVAR